MVKKQNSVSTLVDARVHSIYCGVTQSGKTTLARHHAELLDRADYDVVVYDPVGTLTINGAWPERAKLFADSDRFLECLLKLRSDDDERPIFVFVDEAADIFGHANTDANWIPRRVRHQGVYLRLISQRPKMLPPNVRSQCAHAYMFRLASDDAKMVLADFGHDSDAMEKPLDTGDFLLLVSGSGTIESANVFEICDS